MEITLPEDKVGLILKVGLFVFLVVLGMSLFPLVLYSLGGYFVASALGTFGAAATANTVLLRVFERAGLASVGLGWHAGSPRNLALGLLGGLVAASFVILGPMLAGAAYLEPTPQQPGSFWSLVFVSVLLLFGAIGEELLFRGYAFQLLLRSLGQWATILPTSMLFGIAHSSNQNVSGLGLVNTVGFGVVFGYAFIRSGDLWLPIGLHFGWNWTLPLFGVNLSGFTMGVTGFAVRWTAGDLWSGGSYGPEASLPTAAAIMALMFFLARAPVQPQAPHLIRSVPET